MGDLMGFVHHCSLMTFRAAGCYAWIPHHLPDRVDWSGWSPVPGPRPYANTYEHRSAPGDEPTASPPQFREYPDSTQLISTAINSTGLASLFRSLWRISRARAPGKKQILSDSYHPIGEMVASRQIPISNHIHISQVQAANDPFWAQCGGVWFPSQTWVEGCWPNWAGSKFTAKTEDSTAKVMAHPSMTHASLQRYHDHVAPGRKQPKLQLHGVEQVRMVGSTVHFWLNILLNVHWIII